MKRIIAALLAATLLGGLVYATSRTWGSIPAFSYFLDVWNGAYRTARLAQETCPAMLAAARGTAVTVPSMGHFVVVPMPQSHAARAPRVTP